MKGDSFVKNHFVSENSKRQLIVADEVISIQFQRLVTDTDGKKKYARATVNADHEAFMEIIKKYNLDLQGRWQTWNSEKKTNVPYSGGFQDA